ncbi:ParM/StbA family protein [Sporosalibacterium faouarense]|uniref:ParM/StbA family protein n=1 Tax=Sporosalibacterium faouarense TaxID=516123 RepID=UPI00192B4877|nr:ParM/StbA family protein [Sporosalibacterium faouarense]
MLHIFSVDPGKRITKFAWLSEDGEIKVDSFPTKYTEINELNDSDIVGEDSFLVKYNEQKLVVGAQGELDSLDKRTKKNSLHKIAAFTAVTRMLKDKKPSDEDEIVLINTIPGTSYKSKELKKQYIDFYLEEKEQLISVNDKDFSFTIKDTCFLPEGIGFKFKYPEFCKAGKVCVVDIGGFNIGITVYNNGAIERIISLDLGGIELENDTIELLEAKLDQGIDKKNILKYLGNGYVEDWGIEVEGSREIIKNSKCNYIEKFIKEAANKKVYFKDMDKINFIGGTSLSLTEEIKAHKNLSNVSEVFKDGKYITVIGNLLYGVRKYNGRSI